MMRTIANIASSAGIDTVAIIFKICVLSMGCHWQKKSEEQYEREFREESWEPYEVYLRQRAQRQEWSRFTLRDHQQFWPMVHGFASSIIITEQLIKEYIELINRRRFCLELIKDLESRSDVKALRQKLMEEIVEAEERLRCAKMESERNQVNLARMMFSAPYRYLRIIRKLFLCRIIQHGYLGGPTQRIFRVQYPANTTM